MPAQGHRPESSSTRLHTWASSWEQPGGGRVHRGQRHPSPPASEMLTVASERRKIFRPGLLGPNPPSAASNTHSLACASAQPSTHPDPLSPRWKRSLPRPSHCPAPKLRGQMASGRRPVPFTSIPLLGGFEISHLPPSRNTGVKRAQGTTESTSSSILAPALPSPLPPQAARGPTQLPTILQSPGKLPSLRA